jgi:glycine/D-amino acid oxidase-like deaminating enzyme
MKTQARVVVIGGGAIGVSVAYHLAKYGWKDVVLIEKHELTSGSTWMAAGNCSFFHGNYYCTQVNMKSIEIYQQAGSRNRPERWLAHHRLHPHGRQSRSHGRAGIHTA